jgi:RNA-directed DNA polymerase
MSAAFVETALFDRLLNASPFSYSELAITILTAPNRYKEHTIEKRRGGTRLISQPTKELKFLQRILINNELSSLPVSSAATAYVKGISIRNHAQQHAKNHFLLKLDFRDFFPSIKSNAIDRLLRAHTTFSQDEIFIARQILLRRTRNEADLHLSIGSPSSPFISNTIMYEFDTRLLEYCSTQGLAYSRYADDLAISTKKPGALDNAKGFIEQLLSELSYLNLELHPEKTVNVSTKRRRTLTGLILSNAGTVSIGRDKKRLLRTRVHRMIQGNLDDIQANEVKGLLAFTYSVDPVFIEDLARHYGLTNAHELLKYKA